MALLKRVKVTEFVSDSMTAIWGNNQYLMQRQVKELWLLNGLIMKDLIIKGDFHGSAHVNALSTLLSMNQSVLSCELVPVSRKNPSGQQ